MSSYDQIISSFIDEAECADDLLNVLRCIPLDRLKEIVHAEIRTQNAEEIRSVCVDSCPMDHILPNDAIQTVLSFTPHQSSNKLINKTFKKLVTRNQVVTKGQLGDDKEKWCAFVKEKRKELKLNMKGFQRKRKKSVSKLQSNFNGIIDSALKEMDSLLEQSPYHERENKICGHCLRIVRDRFSKCEGCSLRACSGKYVYGNNEKHCITTNCGEHDDERYNHGVYCHKCWDKMSSTAYNMIREYNFQM